MYAAWSRRRLIESLERRKNMMVSALWANSNYDGDGKGSNPRTEAIEEIDRNYEQAIALINAGPQEQEPEDDADNPFFAAAKRGVAALDRPLAGEDGTVKDVIDYSEGIDQ